MNLEKTAALGGALLAAGLGGLVWGRVAGLPRLYPGWEQKINFVSSFTYPDPKTGLFPDKVDLGRSERATRMSARPDGPGLAADDSYLIRDYVTGKVTWEYRTVAIVDPASGALQDSAHRDEQYVFPRRTERKTYRLSWSYVDNIPLAFEREEEIEGLGLYLFSYHGAGEYTQSYGGTPDYPGVKVKPGETIRCADDQWKLRLWVEPSSGELVKLDESCASGDYIYAHNGKKIGAIMRWGGVTTGDSLVRRIIDVRIRKRNLYLIETVLPAAAAALGALFLAFGLWTRRAHGPEI